jgi:UDP-glucose 4-epimerase
MKALVTGATGFLGRALALDLAEAHGPENVVVLVRDPMPEAEAEVAGELDAAGIRLVPSDLLALPVADLGDLEFDVLFHLAAETDSGASPVALKVNYRGTANLLESLGREGLAGKRVVLAGATASIDRAERPRALMKETDPPSPRTPYGESKLRAERFLEDYAREYGFAYAVPRFSPVWSPDLSTGFLKAFREQAQGKSPLRLVGWPGRVTMILLADAVGILRHFGESGAADGRAVMVGDGEVYRYAGLMRDIRRMAGGGGFFLPVPGFLWAMVRWFAWLPKLRNFVPWRLSCLIGDDLAVDTALLDSLYPEHRKTWGEMKDEVEAHLRSS